MRTDGRPKTLKKGERKEEVEEHKASGRLGKRVKECARETTFEQAYECALCSRECTS